MDRFVWKKHLGLNNNLSNVHKSWSLSEKWNSGIDSNLLRFKLSSIGYALRCKVAFTNRNPNIANKIHLVNYLNNGDSIYISPHETNIDYTMLAQMLHNKNIKVYFYLMDEPVVNVNIINMLLPYSIKMFVMNNVYDHPNIHNMPIGIRDCEKVVPNHKGFSHDILFQEGQHVVNKEHLCLLCFSFTHEERKTCYNIMKTKDFVLNIHGEYEKQESIHCGKVPVHTNYMYLHKSIYVLSPRGAGEATHRFFEAIYLDTIPIVKRTNTVNVHCISVFGCK